MDGLDALSAEREDGAMAEILVTGGTGTLGRVLVARLQEQGHVPRVLSRRPGPGRWTGEGVPWTVQRATQFHDLLATLLAAMGRSPVLPVLAGARFQPVDVRDVADRLATVAVGPPVGRAADLGGPQVRSMADLARAWATATGRRRAVLPVPLPGRSAGAVREGGLLAPGHADGTITFEEYLAQRPAG